MVSDGPLRIEELGVKDDAEIIIVCDGRYMASMLQLLETPAKSFPRVGGRCAPKERRCDEGSVPDDLGVSSNMGIR